MPVTLCPVLLLGLKDQIRKVCQEAYLVCGEGEEQGGAWMEKVSLQLFSCNCVCNITVLTEIPVIEFLIDQRLCYI